MNIHSQALNTLLNCLNKIQITPAILLKVKTNFEKINTMKPTTEKNKSKESKPLRNNSTKFTPNNLNPNKLAKANANLKKLDELQQLQKIK